MFITVTVERWRMDWNWGRSVDDTPGRESGRANESRRIPVGGTR